MIIVKVTYPSRTQAISCKNITLIVLFLRTIMNVFRKKKIRPQNL